MKLDPRFGKGPGYVKTLTLFSRCTAAPELHHEVSSPTIFTLGWGPSRAAGYGANRAGASLSSAVGARHRRFSAGGGSDAIARLMGQGLSERLGQPFVTENRPGEVTNIATEAVRAAADGYTLLLATSPNATNAMLYPNLSFNFIRDITPIASIGRIGSIMEVNPSFPARTVDEFVTYAKGEPRQDQLCVDRQWDRGSHVWRAVQDDGRDRHGSRATWQRTPALADLMAGQVQVAPSLIPRYQTVSFAQQIGCRRAKARP